METVEIFGVRLHRVTFDEAVRRAAHLVESRVPSMAITANPEMIQQAAHDPELWRVLRSAELVVADGIGVVWASRMLGTPLPERVPGIDLMCRLVEIAAQRKWRAYLLGGKPGIAERAAERLMSMYPGVIIAGTMHGYFAEAQEQSVVEAIKEAAPDLLFVGMGAGRQEKWIARHKRELGVALSMGVGGSFDALVDATKRAPVWMRKANIEWLYRLLREPSRWRRQLALPAFALRVLRERLRRAGAGRTTGR